MFRRIAIAAAVLSAAALLAASPRPATAASASSTLTVQATVLGGCTIAAGLLNLGNYEPGLPTDFEPAPGSITVQCTNGTTFTIDLGNGSYHNGTTRRMAGGAGGAERLRYELYEDAGRTQAWGTGAVSHSATTAGAGLSAYSVQVWGRIPSGQFVSTGTYSDSVTMTVNF